MDLIGFLCVSLGSSTVQLEKCTTEEQSSVVRFLLEKGLNTKDIHK
jgi:hypothetical protein